ncbi:MAG TPA: phosphate ABC transporter permease PstA, partial [Candidatus Polarisedimenticolia bacterium]|nr:phosphate ABC transporter permease PstA [Candidatus Polarisedimenticolia bacterium]
MKHDLEEPLVWLTGLSLAIACMMIIGLLGLVAFNGLLTFWPRPLVELTLADGTRVLGEITRSERFRPEETGGSIRRRLIRIGNYDLYGEDFRWVSDSEVVSERAPADAWLIERREWGAAIGTPQALVRDGQPLAQGPDAVASAFGVEHERALTAWREIGRLERREMSAVNDRIEKLRLRVRKAGLSHGENSDAYRAAVAEAAREEATLDTAHREIEVRLQAARDEASRSRLLLIEPGGRLIPERPAAPETPLGLSQIVRAYPANALTFSGRVGVYLDRWKEYLFAEPREANTEGGVFPAIFGTFVMTVLMSLAVAPLGVIAALYLREYARQGPLVSTVRIAVNNLAGVPSIVFGVFGLGFFCYALGGTIDSLFFPEKLPSPTFGTGGVLWASLTLALLTVPVVIVATEEALAVVPRSLREGSFACGASRWQTIHRIVLPRATPGIMTGLILAMARGAGEVAPLMLTGV